MSDTSALIERLRTTVAKSERRTGRDTYVQIVRSDAILAVALLTTQAAEITRLTERVERAKGVITPFAKVADPMRGQEPHQEVICRDGIRRSITMADFRAAADFLEETKP